MKASVLRLLLLLSVMTLTSCAGFPKRDDAPKPPRIQCKERAPLSPIPVEPVGGSAKAKWQRLAFQLYDLIAERDTARDVTADCLDDARAEGLIR